jgi:hypothetical protein
MSSLVTTYASTLGLTPDRDDMLSNLRSDFYPLASERYVTIQSSSQNQAAKNYDHWNLVLEQLRPILIRAGYDIVHIGASSDTPISGVTHDLRGKTTLSQCYSVIQRSSCHIGVDSCWAHVCGALGKPLVSLYGSTCPKAHGPYWKNETKTILLESHRFGNKPSFSVQEPIKTINLIRPEQVVSSVAALLNLKYVSTHETIYAGPNFYTPAIDLVPNIVPNPAFNPNVPMTVRMDKLFDENILLNVLNTGRAVSIITNRPLTKKCLEIMVQFRSRVLGYYHELAMDCPTAYVTSVKRILPKCVFFTRLTPETNKEQLTALRFKFFDIAQIITVESKTREHFTKDTAKWANKPIDIQAAAANLVFKSSKYVLSGGKMYSSHAHLEANKPLTNEKGEQVGELDQYSFTPIVDTPAFWEDMLHYLVVDKSNSIK